MTTKQEQGLEVLEQLLGSETFSRREARIASEKFGAEFSRISQANVFESLWTRPGLNARDRSLLTLGILIALRAESELAIHLPGAVRNGLTVQEIEEAIYHSTAYAGFPAANLAKFVGIRVLSEAGMLD